MASDILYTGKGFSQPLQSDGGRSMSRLSDFITKAEELKYSTFKQNEQEFLKNSNIDPAFFISTANQKTQAGLLEAYNQKWSQKMKQSGYNMSMEDKMAMQAEKNYIIANQQEMQTRQDLWMQHRNMIMQNPTKFDAEEWAQYDDVYRRTGEYPLVSPPIKAHSLDMALEDNPVVGNVWQYTEKEEQGGLPGLRETSYSGDETQARKRVRDLIIQDEAVAKDAVKQFNSLDEQTKLQYLDADKNGTISPEEKKDFNPIIKWAQDTKWKTALKINESKWKSVARGTSTNKPKFSFKYGTGNWVNYTPPKAIRQKLGATTYEKYHPFGQFETYEIPTQDIEIQTMNGNRIKVAQKNLSVKLTGYSEDRDEFTFTVMKDYMSNNSRGQGDQIAVKRSQLPLEWGDIQIELDDGKVVKVGSLSAQSSTETTSNSAREKMENLRNGVKR